MKHTSQELSKWLHEKGFRGESDEWWSGADKGTKYERWEVGNYSDHGDYPAYDLLWDLAYKYKDEIWGNGNEAEVARETFILMTLNKKWNIVQMENHIKEKSAL